MYMCRKGRYNGLGNNHINDIYKLLLGVRSETKKNVAGSNSSHGGALRVVFSEREPLRRGFKRKRGSEI